MLLVVPAVSGARASATAVSESTVLARQAGMQAGVTLKHMFYNTNNRVIGKIGDRLTTVTLGRECATAACAFLKTLLMAPASLHSRGGCCKAAHMRKGCLFGLLMACNCPRLACMDTAAPKMSRG